MIRSLVSLVALSVVGQSLVGHVSFADSPATVAKTAVETSVGLATAPPETAKVLFDGSRESLDQNWTYWEGPRFRSSLPIRWKIVDDPVDEGTVLEVNDPVADGGLYGTADIVTKQPHQDIRLHLEFLIPNEGGNSGVYLQNRYEIQILDGDKSQHGMATVINEVDSPYHLYEGLGKWNSYDMLFRAARFEDGELTERARVTLYFNGTKVFANQEIKKVWGGENSGIDGGNDNGFGITPTPGGLKLQNEGHPILYRNIWMQKVDLGDAETDF